MTFLHDVVIKEMIEIEASPAQVFRYLTGIVDDAGFKALNADNIGFCWLNGEPWAEGSIAFARKYLHGKPHGFRFVVTRIVPDRHIEYRPTSGLMRRFFPKKEFIMEESPDGCRLISSATFRVGWIGKTFFQRKIDDGFAHFRAYLQIECKNLKHILDQSGAR